MSRSKTWREYLQQLLRSEDWSRWKLRLPNLEWRSEVSQGLRIGKGSCLRLPVFLSTSFNHSDLTSSQKTKVFSALNMSLKRKRQERNAGLAPGEKLKLQTAPQVSSNAPWGWVATEVSEVDEITLQHRLSTCNLSSRNKKPRCRNIYSSATIKIAPRTAASSKDAHGEPEDDVIVISDAEDETCSKTLCKLNPFCLNYLGQDKWEDEGLRHLRPFLTSLKLTVPSKRRPKNALLR